MKGFDHTIKSKIEDLGRGSSFSERHWRAFPPNSLTNSRSVSLAIDTMLRCQKLNKNGYPQNCELIFVFYLEFWRAVGLASFSFSWLFCLFRFSRNSSDLGQPPKIFSDNSTLKRISYLGLFWDCLLQMFRKFVMRLWAHIFLLHDSASAFRINSTEDASC